MKGRNGRDLTHGPIPRLLLTLTTPIAFSLLIFTLYLVSDLYFVGRLGSDAVADEDIEHRLRRSAGPRIYEGNNP